MSEGEAVLETERLRLRRLGVEDAPFIGRLLNDADFLRHIGDRGVRTVEEARAYIAAGPVASHREHGFGTDLVVRREDGAPLGVCGIMRKPWLEEPDLAYAFLPEGRGRGWAREAAAAVLADAQRRLGLTSLVAVVTPDNAPSLRLLEALGFERADGVADPTSGAELVLLRWRAARDAPAASAVGGRA